MIADPVRHSISPAVHNRAFQAKRTDAVYLPFLVHPPQLKDFMTLAEKLPISGFSVTIPHKQRIVRYIDIIDPLARRIGAVNTVIRKAGRWRGTNTDVAGVIEPLARRIKLRKASILLVGNGGAARGAAFALTDAGAALTIVGRNVDRVRALARTTGASAITADQLAGKRFDVVVHATSRHAPPHRRLLLRGRDTRSDCLRYGVQPPRDEAYPAGKTAGSRDDSRLRDVPGAGRPSVRIVYR
ncbi:MAG: hypothetical protein WKF37_13085 [Bryobacteraceae bacterium]